MCGLKITSAATTDGATGELVHLLVREFDREGREQLVNIVEPLGGGGSLWPWGRRGLCAVGRTGYFPAVPSGSTKLWAQRDCWDTNACHPDAPVPSNISSSPDVARSAPHSPCCAGVGTVSGLGHRRD